MPVSYAEICEEYETRRGFCGVAEDEPPLYGKIPTIDDDEKGLYGTEEELYAGILDSLAERYLKDRYSLCLEIRHEDKVVYTFPKIACPRLIVTVQLVTYSRSLRKGYNHSESGEMGFQFCGKSSSIFERGWV